MSSSAAPPRQEPPPLNVLRSFGEPRFHTESDVMALAFADDDTVWTAEEHGELRQWSAEGRPLGRHLLSDLETLWTFSPGARHLASASDDITVWDVATGAEAVVLPQLSWITALAFSADGQLLAVGHDDGEVRVWRF